MYGDHGSASRGHHLNRAQSLAKLQSQLQQKSQEPSFDWAAEISLTETFSHGCVLGIRYPTTKADMGLVWHILSISSCNSLTSRRTVDFSEDDDHELL